MNKYFDKEILTLLEPGSQKGARPSKEEDVKPRKRESENTTHNRMV